MTPCNLLVIMDDEHNKKVLGCNGHPLVRTPNLDRLAAAGTTVIVYSSEDSELLTLCDRILVLNGGAITADLTGERLTPFELTRACYGEAA